MCAINPESVNFKSAIAYKLIRKTHTNNYRAYYQGHSFYEGNILYKSVALSPSAYGFHAYQFLDHAREIFAGISIRNTYAPISEVTLVKVKLENILTIGLDGSKCTLYITDEMRATGLYESIYQYPIYIAQFQTILEEINEDQNLV